jgi:lipopolysaccharide/colanic/teichoic acid biosynthesis glycosyltransferase
MSKGGKSAIYRRTAKRFLDLLIVFAAAPIVLPLVALIALWILVSLGKPVLFRQQRPGLNARPFTLLKFRTMTTERDSNGSFLSDEARLTRTGAFLRRLSLDELPQLGNVLKGDMSLVGPRPLLIQYLDRYTPEQARRHEVKPGITGWAQANGRNALTWEAKFDLDVWYIDNWSLRLDVQILCSTVFQVVKRKDISQPGHATSEEFLGNSTSV